MTPHHGTHPISIPPEGLPRGGVVEGAVLLPAGLLVALGERASLGAMTTGQLIRRVLPGHLAAGAELPEADPPCLPSAGHVRAGGAPPAEDGGWVPAAEAQLTQRFATAPQQEQHR